jgi:hypothetical protein
MGRRKQCARPESLIPQDEYASPNLSANEYDGPVSHLVLYSLSRQQKKLKTGRAGDNTEPHA